MIQGMAKAAVRRRLRYRELFQGEIALSRALLHMQQVADWQIFKSQDAQDRADAYVIIDDKLKQIRGEQTALNMTESK